MTLMVAMAVYAIRMLRDNLIDVLDSEYVRMATLKGVPRWRVVLRHALPNAVGPALNVTALNLTYLIGGVVVVESVFSYPGLGKLLVDSISVRDVPVVEATALLAAAVYILANLVADVLAIIAQPAPEDALMSARAGRAPGRRPAARGLRRFLRRFPMSARIAALVLLVVRADRADRAVVDALRPVRRRARGCRTRARAARTSSAPTSSAATSSAASSTARATCSTSRSRARSSRP